MSWLLFLIILIILFVITVLSKKNEKLLLSHIQQLYPDEWDKFTTTKMGVKPNEVLPDLLKSSIQYGFLSTQNDSQLIYLYKKFKLYKYLSLGLFIVSILCLAGMI
jgi:hypothetical protein